MPTVKDAAQISDFVITIHDLKRHIRSFYNIPSSTVFHLRTWTNPNHGSKKRMMNLKDDQYIVDLEDAHDGRSPLVIVLRWTEPAEQRNSCRVRQKLELKDKQGRTHKQAEIDKHNIEFCRAKRNKSEVYFTYFTKLLHLLHFDFTLTSL